MFTTCGKVNLAFSLVPHWLVDLDIIISTHISGSNYQEMYWRECKCVQNFKKKHYISLFYISHH